VKGRHSVRDEASITAGFNLSSNWDWPIGGSSTSDSLNAAKSRYEHKNATLSDVRTERKATWAVIPESKDNLSLFKVLINPVIVSLVFEKV
jgi:hypothetical protein